MISDIIEGLFKNIRLSDIGVINIHKAQHCTKENQILAKQGSFENAKNIQIEVGYDTVRYFMFFLPFMSRVFWYFSDTYARIKSNVRSTLIFFFDRYTQVDIEFLVVVYTVFVCEAEVILLNVLCTQSNILSKPRFAFTDLCK